MVTSTEAFNLTRRNAHQLPDMRTIVHQQSLRPPPVTTAPLELPVLRRASPTSSATQAEWSRSRPTVRRSPLRALPSSQSHSALDPGNHFRQNSSYRLTRTMSELPRSQRSYLTSSSSYVGSSSGASTRHHSLVAMRTYYAFGARSMHTLDRSADHGSSVNLSTYGMYGTSTAPSSLRDAYTSSSTYTPSSALHRSYQSSVSSVSAASRRPAALSSYSASSSSSAYDRYYSAKSKLSSGYSSSPSSYLSSSTAASSSIPSTYRSSTYHRSGITPYTGAATTSFQSVSSSRHYSKPLDSPRSTTSYTSTTRDTTIPTPRSAAPQIVEHVTVSEGKGDSNANGSKRSEAEWQSLSDRNKALEREVEQLKKLLREKERQETELKRKLLEAEAEAKVWQSKYEQTQNQSPQVIHIREPGEEGAISDELVGKLGDATDKLAKLDAFREMALLQTEMEDALKQITGKIE